MSYECRECGSVTLPPRNCVKCGGQSTMFDMSFERARKAEEALRVVRDLLTVIANDASWDLREHAIDPIESAAQAITKINSILDGGE